MFVFGPGDAVGPAKVAGLEGLHEGALFFVGMVVAEQVQDAVAEEQEDFILHAAQVAVVETLNGFERNDDIAQQPGRAGHGGDVEVLRE